MLWLTVLLTIAVFVAACVDDDESAVEPSPTTAAPTTSAEPTPETVTTAPPQTATPAPAPRVTEYRLVRCGDAACATLSTAYLDASVRTVWPEPGSRLPGGFESVAIRPDGRPLVVANTELHRAGADPEVDYSETVVYSCDDAECSTVTTTVMAENAWSGGSQIGAALLPDGSLAIASYEGPEGVCVFTEDLSDLICVDPEATDVSELRLTVCSDPDHCADTAQQTIVDTQGVTGQWPTVMVDPTTGEPMVLYGRKTGALPNSDIGITEVRLARCASADCGDVSIATLTEPSRIDFINDVEPVALPDGAPMFVFPATTDSQNPSLYSCADASCNDVIETPWPAFITDLAIGDDGLPVVVDVVPDLGYTIRITLCGDRLCTEGNETVELVELRTVIFGGGHLSLLPDSRPVVTWSAGSSEVFNPSFVLVCDDPKCTTSTTTPVAEMSITDAPPTADLPVLFTAFFDEAGVRVPG